jgi:hypothetical protein
VDLGQEGGTGVGIPLVVAELTGKYQRSLRRYNYGSVIACSKSGYGCSASVDIAVVDTAMVHGDLWPHDDPRWPTQCAQCFGMFLDTDMWQLNDDRIFRMPDGQEFTYRGSFGRCAPPGTMIRASWFDEYTRKPFGADELKESWLISLPDGGEWITTQKASGGGYWSTHGVPPRITSTPSIFHNAPKGWHGFVTNGELVSA